MAKKKLIYTISVYSVFGNFLARATEITKEKILTYNFLVDLVIRKKSFNTFLKVQISILERVGWKAFVVIATLVAAGAYAYYGSIGAILASNPVLAFALLSATSGAAILIYKNRDFVTASKNVGERYKIDFDLICAKYSVIEDRADDIEMLMNKCVESLISELFRISLEEANKKYRVGNTRHLETSEASHTNSDSKGLLDMVKRLFDKIKSIFNTKINKPGYSYQSLEDIVKYLSGWSLALEKTSDFLENDKQRLINNLYWDSINKDVDSTFTSACLFFRTAITEIDEIQEGIRVEVQPHHVLRLKRLGDTSREINKEWSRVWKIISKAKKK